MPFSEPPRDLFEASARGLQHHGLRRSNERAVLNAVAFNPGASNAEIARRSGLAPQTVSAILNDVERAGLISRGEVLRGRRGQPATPIFLKADGAYAIGMEISRQRGQVVLIDLHAQILASRDFSCERANPKQVIDLAADAIDAVRAALPEARQCRLADLGIAMSNDLGPSAAEGEWSALDVATALASRTGLEPSLFNDGNAGCWAQLIAISAPRPADFVYFQLGHCLSSGIVGQGRLWEGPTGNAANMGSMLVELGGRSRAAHQIASVSALRRRLADAGCETDMDGLPTHSATPAGRVVGEWIEDCAQTLARLVYNVLTVIESDLVVLDSVLPHALTQRLTEALEKALLALPVDQYVPPRIVCGQLGAMAPALGAAELPLYRRHFSRI